jgi:Fic family protein
MDASNATYIHSLSDWPGFRWSLDILSAPLAALRHRQGRLLGQMEALGFPLRDAATLENLTQEVVMSSRIEGEILDRDQVRSSLARRLGLDIGGLLPTDRRVEDVVEMMLDATQRYDEPLTEARLYRWHAGLFPSARSNLTGIRVAAWRDDRSGPMQVVSGPMGRERIHFQAPAAARLPHEIDAFLTWINAGEAGDPVLKAGLAHLWFVTIHPFDDGNGRMARAVAEMALARSEQTPHRFYSMSARICRERSDYYGILERTQKGTLDVTPWLQWFLGCLGRALDGAEAEFSVALAKARFWEANAHTPMNDRQRLVLNRLLDGFEGKLTTSRWASLAKCSHDTALRDIVGLADVGILIKNPGGGRSTSYSLRE